MMMKRRRCRSDRSSSRMTDVSERYLTEEEQKNIRLLLETLERVHRLFFQSHSPVLQLHTFALK